MTAADTIRDIPHDVKRCPDCAARFGVDAAFCPFCGVPLAVATWDPSRDPLTGTIVDNRYEVLGPLGEGGMGTVYKVRHVTLNRLFAMKVLRRDLATDTDLAERFIQEARATAAIKHPAIVSINDFGVLPEHGIPYFVMELLAGETLATRMRARGPLAPRDAIDVARRIADGLAASHAANVIHRDLKPENVFILAPGEIRIVDFGAAKIVGSSKLTRPGVVFGTPYYMSPEQAGGQPIDARADVYSLGVLLYELVTGRVPFEADTYMGVLTKHIFAQPEKPSQKLSGITLGALEDVVMRALEKDPTARYASMAEFIRALDEAERTSVPLNGGPVTANVAPGLTPKMSTAARIEASVARRVEQETRRQRRFLVVSVVAGALTLFVGILILAAVSRQSTSAAAQPPPRESVSPTPPPAPSAVASLSVPSPPAPVASTTSAPAVPPVHARTLPVPKTAPPRAPLTSSSPPSSTTRRPEDFSDPWRK